MELSGCKTVPLSEQKITSDYKTFTSSRRNVTKIILLGDSGVGKTSLINQLINAEFTHSLDSTVGVNLTTKKFTIGVPSSNPEVLVFTDVSGHQRFADIRQAYYKGIEIVLAVADLTNKASLENLEKLWIPEFVKSKPLDEGFRIKVQLIGNKYDLQGEIKISHQELENVASRLSSLFPSEVSFLKPTLFTSAKANQNVNKSFGVPNNVKFS